MPKKKMVPFTDDLKKRIADKVHGTRKEQDVRIANRIKVSVDTVRRWRRTGLIPYESYLAIEDWLNKNSLKAEIPDNITIDDLEPAPIETVPIEATPEITEDSELSLIATESFLAECSALAYKDPSTFMNNIKELIIFDLSGGNICH